MIRIYEFMERVGIRSQQELADRLGLTQSAISAWNSGVRAPTYETCAQLLKMGMTQFELFGIEATPPAVNPKSDDFKTEVKRAIIEALQESMR
jgi:transcriptional regulator with XRE-family HTH domain